MLSDLLAELAALAAGQPWMNRALCAEVDPELWFPGPGQPNTTAKTICARCDVRAACLAYALSLEDNPEGVWGGLSEGERRGLRGEEPAAA